MTTNTPCYKPPPQGGICLYRFLWECIPESANLSSENMRYNFASEGKSRMETSSFVAQIPLFLVLRKIMWLLILEGNTPKPPCAKQLSQNLHKETKDLKRQCRQTHTQTWRRMTYFAWDASGTSVALINWRIHRADCPRVTGNVVDVHRRRQGAGIINAVISASDDVNCVRISICNQNIQKFLNLLNPWRKLGNKQTTQKSIGCCSFLKCRKLCVGILTIADWLSLMNLLSKRVRPYRYRGPGMGAMTV